MCEVLDFKFLGRCVTHTSACYGALQELFGGDEPYIYRPWREVASQELIEKRDRVSPLENNYDGRNITDVCGVVTFMFILSPATDRESMLRCQC